MTKIKLLVLISLSVVSYGQTIYLRDSAPAAAIIDGVSTTTPVVLTYRTPHGFASTCGVSTTCYCTNWGVSTGTGVSPVNGNHICHYVDATHMSLYDMSNVAVPPVVNGYGGAFSAVGTATWGSQVHPYTIGAKPRGYFDGPNGNTLHNLAWQPTSVVVSGGSAGVCGTVACTVTITLNYNPLTEPIPVAAGQKISITGTGTYVDLGGLGGVDQYGYTIASVTSSTIVTVPQIINGLTIGTKTGLNLVCGASVTPNNLIGGTSECTRVSLSAYVGAPWWDAMLRQQTLFGVDVDNGAYKLAWDGGTLYAGRTSMALWAIGAVRFMVDQAPHGTVANTNLWFRQALYLLDHVESVSGVNLANMEYAWSTQPNGDFAYLNMFSSFTFAYDAVSTFQSSAGNLTTRDKVLTDVDNAYDVVASTTNVNMANVANHNWLLASGNIVAGTNDATHVTLASSADCIVGTMIQIMRGSGGDNYRTTYDVSGYGSVQSCVGAVATVNGWINAFGGTTPPPAFDGVYSASIGSLGSLSCQGTTGQTFILGNNTDITRWIGHLSATDTVPTGALSILFTGGGYGSPPTTQNGSLVGQATCTGTANVNTVLGVAYRVFDTVKWSTATQGATATVTWTATPNIAGSIAVGDSIFASNGWYSLSVSSATCYVTAVHTNTVDCVNDISTGNHPTSVAGMAWRVPKWVSGDPGMIWSQKHEPSGFGANTYVYPLLSGASKGSGPTGIIDIGLNIAGQNVGDLLAALMALAPDDQRARDNVSRIQSAMHDYMIGPAMAYMEGFSYNGPAYSGDSDTPFVGLYTWLMQESMAGTAYPSVSGAWVEDNAQWYMYASLPTLYSGAALMAPWGGAPFNGGAANLGNLYGAGAAVAAVVAVKPDSLAAKQFRNWAENVNSYGSTPASFWGLPLMATEYAAAQFLHNPANLGSVDYRLQPTQYAFNNSGVAQCQTLVGGVAGTNCTSLQQSWMVSRSGWNSTADSLLMFGSNAVMNSYSSLGTSTFFTKGAPLLGCDSNQPGFPQGGDVPGCDMVQIGTGTQLYFGLFGQTSGFTYDAPISRWACQSAGAYGCQYGDGASEYAYALANTGNIYNTAGTGTVVSYNNQGKLHFKESGYTERLFQFTDLAVVTPVPIVGRLHFNQNGSTIVDNSNPQGITTCVGGGGCAAVDTNGRQIKSLEGGTSPATLGMMSFIGTPGTVTVVDKCLGHGTGGQTNQCMVGDTYTGGVGYSHLFEINAGTVGSNQTAMTFMTVHKVMVNSGDTTFRPVELNPDSHWFGLWDEDSVSGGVYVEARNNTLQSTMTAFTVTPTVKTQYVLGGLVAGTYTPRVNGIAVSSCNGGTPPCTVSANDNSLYFKDTHIGSVTISLVPNSILGGSGGKNVAVKNVVIQ